MAISAKYWLLLYRVDKDCERTMDREYHLRREVNQLRIKLARFENEEEQRERLPSRVYRNILSKCTRGHSLTVQQYNFVYPRIFEEDLPNRTSLWLKLHVDEQEKGSS